MNQITNCTSSNILETLDEIEVCHGDIFLHCVCQNIAVEKKNDILGLSVLSTQNPPPPPPPPFWPLTTTLVFADKGRTKHNKRWTWFHIYLVKAPAPEKEKQPLVPQFSLSFFSAPQNYNVQIHKRICCFYTLEINTTVGRECRCSAAEALKPLFQIFVVCVCLFPSYCLSVCLVLLNHTLPNHGPDY